MTDTEFEDWLRERKAQLRIINKLLHHSECGSAEGSKLFDEADALLNEVCEVYLSGTAYQRVAIRQCIDSHDRVKGLLLYHPSRVAELIHTPADLRWLRIGLAAALIENMSFDPRDTLLTLSDLYLAAERAGIDPIPHFETAGTPSDIGDPLPSNGMFRFIVGRSPTQGILKSFLQSEQLRYAIAHGRSRHDPQM